MEEPATHKPYLGIPREMIPWYPTIDSDACTACGLCVQSCKHGTYAYHEDQTRVIVAQPYACEVFCESCRFQCADGAISFPDRKSVRLIVKQLHQQYPPTE